MEKSRTRGAAPTRLAWGPPVDGSLALRPGAAAELINSGICFPKDELVGLTGARAGVAASPAPWRGLRVVGDGLPARGGARSRQVAAGARTSLGMKPGREKWK